MSMRAAINAKCRDCIHDPCAPGTWREQVAQCSSINCALWPLRPGPHSGPSADPPRDPATVSQEWLRAAAGEASSALPWTKASGSGRAVGVPPLGPEMTILAGTP